MSGFLHGCNLEIYPLVFVGSVVFLAVGQLGLLTLLGLFNLLKVVFWGVLHVLTSIESIGIVEFVRCVDLGWAVRFVDFGWAVKSVVSVRKVASSISNFKEKLLQCRTIINDNVFVILHVFSCVFLS